MDLLDIVIAKQLAGGGGGSGTDNYNDLSNLPQINGNTLAGDKTASSLGLQDEIDSDNKLSSDLVDDTNATNKFVTEEQKNTWNGKQNAIDNSHKLSSDLVDDANHTNKFVTSTEKQTWNAKQNAIDADHKLSSSLVSFTDAEAAALASGIDSSKVGQISTNQTNILLVQDATKELVDKGAKNKLDISGMATQTMRGITFSQSNGVITASGNNDNTGGSYVDIATLSGAQMQALKGHILSGSVNISGYLLFISRKASPGNTVVTSDSGSPSDPIPDNIDYECTVTVYIPQGATQSTPTKFYPMICSEAEWKLSPEFEPHALPNSDLTQLQSEDRNSIQHLVYNGGGRNIFKLFDLSEIKSQCGTLNVSMSDDYTLTVSGSDTSAHFASIATVTPSKTGDYTFSSVDGDINKCAAYIKIGDVYYWAYSGFTSKIPMVAGTSYTVVLRYLANTTGTYNFKFMVREADISDTTYQPYALPNSDLTQLQSEDRAALAEVVDSGAKNLADFINGGTVYNVTKTVSGNAFTITTTGVHGRIFELINVTKSGNFTIACTISNLSVISDSARIIVSSDINANSIISNTQITSNGKVEINFNTSLTAFYVHIFSTYGNYSDANTLTISDFMICSEEAFRISPKFVPFTLKQPRVIFKNFSGTVSNTEAVIPDLSLTVNKTCLIRVSITATYNSNSPRLLRVATNNDMAGNSTIEVKEINSDQGQLSVVAVGIFYANSNNTVYISAKYSGTGTNSVKALYEIFEV